MTGHRIEDILWTTVSVANRLFAIPAQTVQSMVPLPPVTQVPQVPAHVRGVINLRGRLLPLLDLRVRLGLPALHAEVDELDALLVQREQDHRNWLTELEAAVRERREFRLATDPHKCAFGRWYDAYRTDNALLATLLKQFDEPHQRIHGIACEVLALAGAGDSAGAQQLIDDTRDGPLAEMLRLFAVLRAALRDAVREIVVVVETPTQTFAVAVDSVEMVTHLSACGTHAAGEGGLALADHRLVKGVGQMPPLGKLVLVLDAAGLLDTDD